MREGVGEDIWRWMNERYDGMGMGEMDGKYGMRVNVQIVFRWNSHHNRKRITRWCYVRNFHRCCLSTKCFYTTQEFTCMSLLLPSHLIPPPTYLSVLCLVLIQNQNKQNLPPSERPKIWLLEYDKRFEVFNNEFVYYDFNKPLKLPRKFSSSNF